MKTRAERFFEKIRINKSGCWIWTGSTSKRGYGEFWNGERVMAAHHFLLCRKPAPNLEACHRCDVRNCVNPQHIFWGTRSDNVRDMFSKERQNKEAQRRNALRLKSYPPRIGEEVGTSKLTEAQVIEARTTHPIPGVLTNMAKRFGVTIAALSAARNGKTWKHITVTPCQLFFRRKNAAKESAYQKEIERELAARREKQ